MLRASALCVLLALGPRAAAAAGSASSDDYVLDRAAMAYLTACAVAGGQIAVPTGPAEASFPDVPTDYWAYRYIEYCHTKGVTTGYQDGTFGPADTVTRGQAAAFVSRALAGSDANIPAGPETPTFTDVSTDYNFYRYIEYLNQHVTDAAYSTDPLTFAPELGMSALLAASWLEQTLGTRPDPSGALVADFSAAPAGGPPPLTVAFTDLSQGSPISWAWDFGDGGTATETNPVHTYTAVGRYTVTLRTTNAEGYDLKVKADYLPVVIPPVADFLATPRGGPAPLEVAFLDRSAHTPTGWNWSFGDGQESPVQNPRHTYAEPGSYAVTLTVSNLTGVDAETREHYITVTFTDVPLDSWAVQQILACVGAGIVTGYPGNAYQPDTEVTRDQMAVYIARALAGGDAAVPTGPADAAFDDVPVDHWAFRYVEYAAAQHIVVGYWNGYRPTEPLTRAQMATYIARAVVTPHGDNGLVSYTPPATPTFTDVAADSWAYRYIEYCAGHDIVQGYWDGYHPEGVVTRAQMAVFVQRAFDLPMPAR